MKKNVKKNLLEGKSSLYSDRLVYSTSQLDYTYQELSEKINSVFRFVTDQVILENKKVMILLEEFDDVLIASLGLIKAQADLYIITPEIDETSFSAIIEEEKPSLIITSIDHTHKIKNCKKIVWDRNIVFDKNNIDQIEPDGNLPIIRFKIVSDNKEIIAIDEKKLEHVYNSVEKSLDIGANLNQNYLIAGQLDIKMLLVETICMIFNGIHVLHYPVISKKLNNLRPCDTIFPIDFSLFFFGNSIDDSKDLETYKLLLNSAEHADKHGYTSVWTPERHFNEFGGRFPNPSILSAAIAVKTDKIQIRTGSIVAPLHHTVRIAEDWSIIDNLSRGRTALSFASGWQCNDFIFSPENYDNRHEIMLKKIDDVRKLWSGEELEFPNGVGDQIKIKIFPKPFQKELPIWITVSGKTETFVDAGKMGANILTHLLWQDPSDLQEKIQAYRNSLKENGFDPQSKTVSVMLHTFVGEDLNEVKKIVKKPLKNYIKSSVHLVETMTAAVKKTKGNNSIGRYGKTSDVMSEDLKEELLDIAFERFFNSASLLGDFEHCSNVLKKLKSFGVDELACLIDFGLDDQTILQGLENLNKLKHSFSPQQVKRYSGPFILRTEQDSLEAIHELGDDTFIESFKKLAVSIEEEKTSQIAFKNQVNYMYSWEHESIFTSEKDLTFVKKEAEIHKKNISQASQIVSEEF